MKLTYLKGMRMMLGAVMFLVAVGISSCKKVDDEPSTRLQPEAEAWKNIDDAKANLLGCYTLLRNALATDETHWLMGELRGGDFLSTNRSDLKAIIDGRLSASYPIFNDLTNWKRFYAVINATSLFIERSSEIVKFDPRYTELNNKVDIAQARAVRAFAYFYMVRIWGDVPLITTSNDGKFISAKRTSQAEVLKFCTDELTEAAQVVPFRYGSNDPILPGNYYSRPRGDWNGILFTRISVYVTLAHIAAWQQNYIDVDVYTKFILDNYTRLVGNEVGTIKYLSIYELTYEPSVINASGSSENANQANPFAYKRVSQLIGFPFEYGFNNASYNGHIEKLTLAYPLIPRDQPEIYVPKDSIRHIFTDPGDLRFSLDPVTNRYRKSYFYNYETETPMFKKIAVIGGGSDVKPSNFMVFTSAILFSRLEEISLLRAEAMAVLGNRNEAISNLNKAAALRKTTPYADGSSTDLIDAIFAERRRELMGEGWRWYDLVRYNRIKRNNSAFNKLIQEGGIYWPISKDVLSANPEINQNNYWK